MFRLDYLSCFLTILATVLVGRKSWTGLLLSIANSLIVCVIGFRTSQFGFIPANLICICVYAFSMRSWLKKAHTYQIRNHARASSVPSSSALGAKGPRRPMTIGQEALMFNSAARRGYHLLPVARTRKHDLIRGGVRSNSVALQPGFITGEKRTCFPTSRSTQTI
jgi:hypothetical protein